MKEKKWKIKDSDVEFLRHKEFAGMGCGVHGPGGLVCTRERDHQGPHVSHVEYEPVAMWVPVDSEREGSIEYFTLRSMVPAGPRSVIVVSFFPGNIRDGGLCGGFDWWPDNEEGREAARRYIQTDIAKEWAFTELAFTATAFRLPAHLSVNDIEGVTEWLDNEMRDLRELGLQEDEDDEDGPPA